MKKMKLFLVLCGLLAFTSSAYAQTTLLTEGFEAGEVPAGWTLIDADGDGNNWESDPFNEEPGQGRNGGKCISSASFINNFGPVTPDNYLITPMVTGATQVKYWVSGQDAAYAGEHYAVCASSTGTAAADFTIIFEETVTGAKVQGVWHERSVNLPSGTKYVAFRHYDCTDMFYLNLDDVSVIAGVGLEDIEGGVSANLYPNPIKDKLNIECSQKIENIEVYDALGRQVISTNSHVSSLDCSQLESGMYILKLRTDKGLASYKIIKE